jgi:hypothetical protein
MLSAADRLARRRRTPDPVSSGFSNAKLRSCPSGGEMSIEKLIELMSPPIRPVELPMSAGAWEEVETRLGTRLPRDYKAFIERFGSVYIDRFLSICNPFSRSFGYNLECQLEMLRGYGMDDVLFPNQGGLIPFGGTDNGDTLFWETSGEPDAWYVVVDDGERSEYERFQRQTMTDFLWRLLSRNVRCRFFPDDFPGDVLTCDAIDLSRLEEANTSYKHVPGFDAFMARLSAMKLKA